MAKLAEKLNYQVRESKSQIYRPNFLFEEFSLWNRFFYVTSYDNDVSGLVELGLLNRWIKCLY